MNSSISNFRQEAKVLIIPLALLAGCELLLRLNSTQWSADGPVLQTLGTAQRTLVSHPPATVLFLGNSLTRDGVRIDVIEQDQGWRDDGMPNVFAIALADTTIIDWYCLFDRYFYRPRATPDVLILGYAGRQVDDSSAVQPSRLALYAGWGQIPELFKFDLPRLGDRAEYLLCMASRCFAYRDRIRNRLLQRIIPAYGETAGEINANLRVKGGEAPRSYERLRRLLRLCRDSDTLPVLMTVATPGSDSVDPALPLLVQQYGGVMLDLHEVQGLTRQDYSDGYHLNGNGAITYSRALARRMFAHAAITTRLRRGNARTVALPQ